MRAFVKLTDSTGQTLYVDPDACSAVRGEDSSYTTVYQIEGQKFMVREKLAVVMDKLGIKEKTKPVEEKDGKPATK